MNDAYDDFTAWNEDIAIAQLTSILWTVAGSALGLGAWWLLG